MSILDTAALRASVVPPLDGPLTTQLLDEYVSMEQRFVLGDWGPATLDGGQFAEAAARILYHQDSGNLDRRKGVDSCLGYVEDPGNSNLHSFPERKSALHIARIIRSIYKFRSDRGAVHIDPTYTANQLDAKLVLENARWVLGEMLRIFWSGDHAEVSRTVRTLVRHFVPSVGEFDGRLLVQRTDCSAEEEILLLLHHAGQQGFSRKELGQFMMKSPSSVTGAIRTLEAAKRREITQLANGNYCLTDLGLRRVLTELGTKLLP